jgi:chromosome segregation ATPase
VVELIEDLLKAPASGAQAPSLERLEEALTDGYAQALALEAERWRIERRLYDVARRVDGSDVSALADELTSLGRRLTSTDDELEKLRSLLDVLQQRARDVRRVAQTTARS